MKEFLIGDERSAALERIERDAWFDMWRAVNAEAALSLRIAHVERAGMALTAMRGYDLGLFNRAQGLGCDGPTSEADIAHAVAWLREHCAPAWRIQVAAASLAGEFDACTTRLGLVVKGHGPAKMYRDASPLPPIEGDTEFDVRPVTFDEASLCVNVCSVGFGIPTHVMEALTRGLVGRPRWRPYVAYHHSTPVAFGLMFVEDEWAWLGWGSTLPTYRGRGAQVAILRRRIAEGLALGVKHFAVECVAPSKSDRSTFTSYRNIVRTGFSEAYIRAAYGPA